MQFTNFDGLPLAVLKAEYENRIFTEGSNTPIVYSDYLESTGANFRAQDALNLFTRYLTLGNYGYFEVPTRYPSYKWYIGYSTWSGYDIVAVNVRVGLYITNVFTFRFYLNKSTFDIQVPSIHSGQPYDSILMYKGLTLNENTGKLMELSVRTLDKTGYGYVYLVQQQTIDESIYGYSQFLEHISEITDYVEYDFKSIYSIFSPSKHINLSTIKDSETNHGFSVTNANKNVIQNFTDESKLSNLFGVCTVNTEKKIAECGEFWLSVYPTTVDANGVPYIFELRYYVDNETYISYQYTFNSSDATKRAYLSFLIDNTNNVATPSIIYLNNDDSVTYNQDGLDNTKINFMWLWLQSYIESEPDTPYPYTPDSDVGGGGGTQDDTSTPPTVSNNPLITPVWGKFVKLYSLTQSDAEDLKEYMWAHDFESIVSKKWYGNPIQMILSIHALPFSVSTSVAENVFIGGHDTELSFTPLSTEIVNLHIGDYDFAPYFNSCYDFAPYQTIELFLPFASIITLDTNDCIGRQMSVDCTIDCLSGNLVYRVSFVGRGFNSPTVLYTANGNCAQQIPISSADYTSFLNTALSFIGTVASGVSAVATGGLTAPLAISSAMQTVSNVANSQVNISHGGLASANFGSLSRMVNAFLIFKYPNLCKPNSYETLVGQTLHITKTLSELSGYTEVEEIHLDNMTCTMDEAVEIENLLKGGVIL